MVSKIMSNFNGKSIKGFLRGFWKGTKAGLFVFVDIGFAATWILYCFKQVGDFNLLTAFLAMVLLNIVKIHEEIERIKIPVNQNIKITFVSPDDPEILATLVKTEHEQVAEVAPEKKK